MFCSPSTKSPLTIYLESDSFMELHPFQVQGVTWLRSKEAALLADEPGLGKTAQAVVATKSFTPCLIVCPNSSKYFWASEIHKWGGVPKERIYVYESWHRYEEENLFNQLGVDYYIIHWEGLRYVESQLIKRKWGCKIADEAHRMKNRKTQQSKIIRKVKANRRYALTGTPIINSPADMWALLNYLYPDKYRSYWRFFNEWVLAIPRVIAGQIRGYEILGTRNPKAFREELRGVVARRLKKTVQPELPPKLYTTLEVPLTLKERKAYEEMRQEMVVQLSEALEVAAPTVLAQMTRLRQLADGLFLLDSEAPLEGAKLDAVLDFLSDRIGSTVVFTQFVRMAKALHQKLNLGGTPTGIIIGEASAEEREVARDHFQKGSTKVIVLTLATGAESITLTAADTMVFIDRPWSPLTLQQAEDRIHRIGQESETVHYVSIIAIDTVDQRVQELLRKKDFLFRQLFERSDGGLIDAQEVIKLL